MWGRTLADAAGRGTGLTIVACTSRSAEDRAAFAKTYGCRDLPSYAAVLADPEVEGVLITTPHSFISADIGFTLKPGSWRTVRAESAETGRAVQILEELEVVTFKDVQPRSGAEQEGAKGTAFFKWDENGAQILEDYTVLNCKDIVPG